MSSKSLSSSLMACFACLCRRSERTAANAGPTTSMTAELSGVDSRGMAVRGRGLEFEPNRTADTARRGANSELCLSVQTTRQDLPRHAQKIPTLGACPSVFYASLHRVTAATVRLWVSMVLSTTPHLRGGEDGASEPVVHSPQLIRGTRRTVDAESTCQRSCRARDPFRNIRW